MRPKGRKGGDSMAEYQAGFIGCGNMGGVLAAAAAKSGARIAAADHHPEKIETLVRKCGAAALDSAGAVAEKSAFLFLGVKPQAMSALADEIRAVLDRRSGLPGRSERFVLVSMAAGVSMEAVARRFGGPVGTPQGRGRRPFSPSCCWACCACFSAPPAASRPRLRPRPRPRTPTRAWCRSPAVLER